MTRIATAAAAQTALLDLMRSQRTVFETQQQLATGKLNPDLKGAGHRAETIAAAYGSRDRAEGYKFAAERVANKMEITATALDKLSEAATDLRVAMTTIDGTHIMSTAREAFERARDALSTQYAGGYVFGGTRTDTPPISADSLSDLVAAPTAADVFVNSSRRPVAKLDDNYTQEVGLLASEVGTDLMAAFKRLAEFDAGPDGPLNGPLTEAQQTYLQGEIANVLTAFDRINDRVGENGALQSRVEAMISNQDQKADYLTKLIGDLEDADMAEAATRFQQAQTAVDVAAKTFSTLSQVSLLPFLR
ncbi:flagellin [Hyphobacterium sp. HN65]|uniref:Flagellin n=1 Tax=Hyphobacterium lacteum TaxID=3116575 RepID=A0ABU7LQC3_9PROT|nr:flagellin [Hyphobacterium sp. HN65]MEE2526118.1 flagellin [Hyphobacterium sp. HN65]